MNNMSAFNRSLMLGFDELEKMLNQVAKSSESFPPYNIEQLDENTLLISLAVAGYTEQDLEVALEDTQLIIKGRQENTAPRQFLHKGIAGRNFIKSFVLADGMKITSVSLEYGLLNIRLNRPTKKVKRTTLKITTAHNMPRTIEHEDKK